MDDDRTVEQICRFAFLTEVLKSDGDVGEVCADLAVKLAEGREVRMENLLEHRYGLCVPPQGHKRPAYAAAVAGHVGMLAADSRLPDA